MEPEQKKLIYTEKAYLHPFLDGKWEARETPSLWSKPPVYKVPLAYTMTTATFQRPGPDQPA